MECRQNLGFLHHILKIKILKYNLWVVGVVVNICLLWSWDTGRFHLEENIPIFTKAVQVPRGRAVKCPQILVEKSHLKCNSCGLQRCVLKFNVCVSLFAFGLLLPAAAVHTTFLWAWKRCRLVSIKVEFVVFVRLFVTGSERSSLGEFQQDPQSSQVSESRIQLCRSDGKRRMFSVSCVLGSTAAITARLLVWLLVLWSGGSNVVGSEGRGHIMASFLGHNSASTSSGQHQ